MSDFLTTLAARAMGVDVSLRPRPASIFEPVVEPLVVANSEVSAVPSAEDESPDPAPAQRSDPVPGPPPAPVLSPAPRVPPAPPERAREWREPPRLIERTVEERRVLAPEPRPVERPLPAVPPEATVRVLTPPASARVVTIEEKHEVRTTLRRDHTIREETVRRDAPPVPSSRRVRAAQPAPAASRPALPVVPPAAADPPVTIEVTIGRVEVRAVHPAAPSRREAPTRGGPSLSLDAYLRQRNRERP